MTGLLVKLGTKFLKAKWGDLLPAILRAAAAGTFGEPVKKVYWFLAGIKTVTGAVLIALGAGLETVCSNYPAYAWTCEAGKWIAIIGTVLGSVGLIDGGVRSPWPSQPNGAAPFKPEDKGPSA